MPKIEVSGGAALFSSATGLDKRIERLCRAPGFAGAAMFRPVGWFGEKLAYTRWDTLESAKRAVDAGDAATFRAAAVEPFLVALQSAPENHRGKLNLEEPGMVLLAVRMAVDPDRYDELVENLESFTDTFLQRFVSTQAVAFHRSADKSLVIETLHVTSALGLARLQLKRALRRHSREVANIARSETHSILRLESIVAPG